MEKEWNINSNKKIKIMILTSLLTALTAVGAFIKIPFLLVPITLQSLFVLLSGNLLGSRFGALSQLIYLTLGLLGLPIFANGGGPAYVIQPTFGYLLSYPLAAYSAGVFIELLIISQRSIDFKDNAQFVFFGNLISTLIIYVIGVGYLYLNLNYIIGKPISYLNACWTGFIIFLPGDLLKISVVSLLTIRIKSIFIQQSIGV